MKAKNEKISSAAKNAIAMQDAILENMRDENTVLSASKRVRACYHNHVINMKNGKNGILNLILDILNDREANFAKGVENTELRGIAIAASMFTEEIFAECQERFSKGSIRYPLSTIHCYLSNPKLHKGAIGKIKLSALEDSERDSDKPRRKWYAVAQ